MTFTFAQGLPYKQERVLIGLSIFGYAHYKCHSSWSLFSIVKREPLLDW